jgi:hypothetical protein
MLSAGRAVVGRLIREFRPRLRSSRRRALIPNYRDFAVVSWTFSDLARRHYLHDRWRFRMEHGEEEIGVGGHLSSSSGDVLDGWALEGRGLSSEALWDVADDLKAGAARCMPSRLRVRRNRADRNVSAWSSRTASYPPVRGFHGGLTSQSIGIAVPFAQKRCECALGLVSNTTARRLWAHLFGGGSSLFRRDWSLAPHSSATQTGISTRCSFPVSPKYGRYGLL